MIPERSGFICKYEDVHRIRRYICKTAREVSRCSDSEIRIDAISKKGFVGRDAGRLSVFLSMRRRDAVFLQLLDISHNVFACPVLSAESASFPIRPIDSFSSVQLGLMSASARGGRATHDTASSEETRACRFSLAENLVAYPVLQGMQTSHTFHPRIHSHYFRFFAVSRLETSPRRIPEPRAT